MKMSDAFPSKWLVAAELEDGDGNPCDQVFTIKDVVMEEMNQDGSEKPVVYFEETSKGLVLNKTNGKTISSLYGNDSEDWKGERIAVYPTEVNFQGTMTPCIRVRGKAPKKKPTLKDSPKVLTPANPGPLVRTGAAAQNEDIADNDGDIPF